MFCFLTHHAVPKGTVMNLTEIHHVTNPTMADPKLQLISKLIVTGKRHLIDSIDL
jgi:hypothetical protein